MDNKTKTAEHRKAVAIKILKSKILAKDKGKLIKK